MSVLWGASFDNVVCLDIDGAHPCSLRNGKIDYTARRIGERFRLGDCLIVLSSYHVRKWGGGDSRDWSRFNCHLVYDRMTTWENIHHIITTLAEERVLEKKLVRLRLDRRHFTTRISKKDEDGFVPFPVGYVRGSTDAWVIRRSGGIRIWLDHWRIGRIYPKIYGNSQSGPFPVGFPRK